MLRRTLVLCIVMAVGATSLRSTLPTAADDRAPAAARHDETKPVSAEPTTGRLRAPTEVERILAQAGSLQFDDVRLKDFAAKLAAQLHINVLLDRKALAEANIADEVWISVHCDHLPLGDGLRQALARRDLGCYPLADKALLITTNERARSHVVLRIYDVRDLVGYYNAPDPYGCASWADYDSLIDLITSIVAPQSWDSSGGAGQIAVFFGCLFIPQTEDVQDQIGRLLIALRKARDAGPDGGQPIVVDGPRSSLAVAIDARLDTPQDIHFPGGSLPQMTAWPKQLGIPSLADGDAAEQVGNVRQFAAVDLHQVSLGPALRVILSQHKLGYYLADDGLVITTKDEANKRLECVVYPLGFLNQPSEGQTAAGASVNFDELIELFQAAVEAATRGTTKGVSAQSRRIPTRALVCDQTHEAQTRIAKVSGGAAGERQAARSARQPPASDRWPAGAGGERLPLVAVRWEQAHRGRPQRR